MLNTSNGNQPLILIYSGLLLITALIGGASTAVFYFHIQPDCQMLKAAWRMLGFTLALVPLAFAEYLKQKDTYIYNNVNVTNPHYWITMIWSSLGHSIWTVGFLISLNHISVTQASLLANLFPVIVVFYKTIGSQQVSHIEMIGTGVATIGAVFLAFDSDGEQLENDTMDRLVFGVISGILASIGGAFYVTRNQEMKEDYPLCLRVLVTTFMSFVMISFASIILEDATFTQDPQTGIFGLFSSEWIATIIYTVLLTGFGGYFANILALKYFDALLVSIVLTFEPVVAGLMVFALGWQSFPGMITILGGALVIGGIITVIKEGAKHENTSLDKDRYNGIKQGVPLIPLNSE